jgi:hypothetical protein
VVAIRYCVSTPSASRSPLPASTPIITDLLASRTVRRLARRRVPVTAAADPDQSSDHEGPTTVSQRQHAR